MLSIKGVSPHFAAQEHKLLQYKLMEVKCNNSILQQTWKWNWLTNISHQPRWHHNLMMNHHNLITKHSSYMQSYFCHLCYDSNFIDVISDSFSRFLLQSTIFCILVLLLLISSDVPASPLWQLLNSSQLLWYLELTCSHQPFYLVPQMYDSLAYIGVSVRVCVCVALQECNVHVRMHVQH